MSREARIQEIIELTGRLHRPVDPAVMHKMGLSPAQSGMLFMLYHRSGDTMKDFADHMSISKSAVTQLVEPLIENGYVSRNLNPNDKRRAILQITSSGKQKLKQIKQHKAEGIRSALLILDEKELEQLHKIYEKLALNISKQRSEVKI